MASILVIDDDVDILSALRLLLKRHFDNVQIEKNPEKIPFLLNNYAFDVILLDMNFSQDLNSGKEGYMWLDRILDIKPESKVVLFTAYGDIEMAVKAIKLGAQDFVLKPWDNEKLLDTLLNSSKEKKKVSPESTLLGESPAMLALKSTLKKAAPSDANILILGENGTGKDLVAKEIHSLSLRNKNPFVRVDLAAIPETLVESELFGHAKGAFTDAREARSGKFLEANGGTLFLDEIGNLSLTVQSKLLTVLQDRSVTPLGQNKSYPMDIRLIAATNAPIHSLENFRQDLLYRINTITLETPPLRERGEDILLLAEHFLEIYSKKYNRPKMHLSAELKKEMLRHVWEGNVRQLQHAMERAVILASGTSLKKEDVFSTSIRQKEVLGYDLEEMEKKLIVKALKQFNGNISSAAKELGLSRAALYRRIEKYDI